MGQTEGGSQSQPGTDFRDWGGPIDPADTATGSGMSLGVLRTFGDVVAIDSGRHGRERGFFRSKMSGGSEDSFFVYKCTVLYSTIH